MNQAADPATAYAMVEPLPLSPPQFGCPVPVAPGVRWLRTPMPFALDHINLWLLEDGRDFTLVDTGLASDPTKDIWSKLIAEWGRERTLRQLICTHFHPDHAGLAGWLVERLGPRFHMSREEWLTANLHRLDVGDEAHRGAERFYHRVGIPAERRPEITNAFFGYAERVSSLPRSFERIRDGDRIEINGEPWEAIVTLGHAPEHVCLFNPRHKILISGDQVLPKITTNVSVGPWEPHANPLGMFLDALDSLRRLPADVTVLPSHGMPFKGLHARIDQLQAHHDERLSSLRDGLVQPTTVLASLPLLFKRQFAPHDERFALGEALAHLNLLLARGQVVREESGDGIWHFRRV
ncbi:MAG: hypothetical protein AMXMBFR6_24940 [Betaproteobacteria bacterium]|nr:MBL fold metallo-hydrolase [Rhodocyclaceae bacterium]MCG3187201.1 Hydroxyacylglutathione hydrolase [Rhodocyclaceae bacterium]